MNRTPLGALAALCVAGCTVGPNYHPPKMDPGHSFAEVPAQPTTQPSRASEQPVQIDRWWETFHDPELDSLIERALKSNPSLAQAGSRIRQARYERIVAGASELPTLNADAGYQHARGSKNIVFPLSAFGVPAGGGSGTTHGKQTPTRVDQPVAPTNVPVGAPPPGGAPLSPLGLGGLPGASTDLFQAGLDASWELDIFGGVRRSVEAANADYQAAVEDRRDVYVTLMAEVALNYVELRGFQRQIDIARENLGVQQQSLSLTQDRFHAGVTTQLDVSRAQAQVATTASGIPSLDAEVHQTIHRISVLLGEHPAALMDELSKPQQIPPAPPMVPVGVPTDLVRRRPDIRRAERQLAAATARVGVATAQLYPRLSLTGTFGFDATKFTHIGDWSSRYYSIGPSIIWPIFDAGRIRANINIQNENQAQAMSGYEQTVLNALEDVENSLVAYSREQLRRQALSEAVDANRTAVDLANQQYRQGVVDFLTVLEAERSLFGAEDQLAQSDAQISGDLVSLYKALGGGWQVAENPAPTTRPSAQ